MKAFKWLKRLLVDEGGNALMVGAASLPLLLGAAGFAVDSIQIALQKRELQRAADSASIAGAYALSQGMDTHNAVHNDLNENTFPILTQEETLTVGPRLGFDRTVRVQLTAAHPLPFISIFTKAPTVVTSDATAALVQNGNFCLLSLYKGTEAGIDVNGNATLNLGCGMATNSTATQAVTAGGSSSVTASPIMAVGGLDGSSNNFVAPTTLQPNSAPQTDPFAGVPNPAPDVNKCTSSGALSVGPGETKVITDTTACYTSADIKGTLILPSEASLTVYGGALDFGAQANVTGSHFTFVMTGPNGAAGDLKMNGQAALNLTAPTSGDYKRLLFYRDRRASNINIKINGGSDAKLTGAFYFPSSDIEFTGNAGIQVECLMMVGQRLIFRGTATINNSCNAVDQTSGYQLTYIRLVS